MAGENLKILITGSLNVGKSIGEINTQIKALEKKINKLKIKIDVDEKVLQKMNNFAKQVRRISESALNPNKIVEEMTNLDGSKIKRTFLNGYGGAFEEIKKKANESTKSQLKGIDEVAEGYSKLTRQVEKYNATQKKIGETVTYSDSNGVNTRTITANNKGKVTGYTDTYNREKEIKLAQQELKLQEDIAKKLQNQKNIARKSLQELAKSGKYTTDELRKIGQGISFATSIKQIDQLKSRMSNMKFGGNIQQEQERITQGFKKLFDAGKIGEKTFLKFNDSIKSAKNLQELDKIQQKLKLVTNSTNNKALQQKLIGDAQTLLRTHSNTVDTAGVNKLIADLNRLPVSARNASNSLAQAQTQMRNFQQSAQEAARSSMTFGNMMNQALQKFSIWMVSANLIYAPVRALQDMTDRLIQIDTLMVNIQRVMDMPDFKFTELLQDAVSVSDQLSSKLTDMLSIMDSFGRMGFKENELIDIGSTAQILQNISDLDANSAVDTLTSAMLNFNIAAKDSIVISDQLNEIDNNFAVVFASLYRNI